MFSSLWNNCWHESTSANNNPASLILSHIHKPHKLNIVANHILNKCNNVLDLGISFDDNLKFSSHIHGIIQRASQRANLIHRTFLSKNVASLVRSYKVYIRPLLEYNSVIWSPSQIGLINSLESVQRCFTKRLKDLHYTSYADRLSILKLQSLEHRRLINDLVMCYNIVHNRTALIFDEYFQFSHNPSSRGHHLRLTLPLVKTNFQKSFFSWRVIKPWNALPSHIVSAESSTLFKSRLIKADLSKFLIFPSIFSL